MHVFSHACMYVTVCIDLFYNIFACAYTNTHTKVDTLPLKCSHYITYDLIFITCARLNFVIGRRKHIWILGWPHNQFCTNVYISV